MIKIKNCIFVFALLMFTCSCIRKKLAGSKSLNTSSAVPKGSGDWTSIEGLVQIPFQASVLKNPAATTALKNQFFYTQYQFKIEKGESASKTPSATFSAQLLEDGGFQFELNKLANAGATKPKFSVAFQNWKATDVKPCSGTDSRIEGTTCEKWTFSEPSTQKPSAPGTNPKNPPASPASHAEFILELDDSNRWVTTHVSFLGFPGVVVEDMTQEPSNGTTTEAGSAN